jgi:hypothetical protein
LYLFCGDNHPVAAGHRVLGALDVLEVDTATTVIDQNGAIAGRDGIDGGGTWQDTFKKPRSKKNPIIFWQRVGND